jgi:hypothetical protein
VLTDEANGSNEKRCVTSCHVQEFRSIPISLGKKYSL